jgi:hypothetical protein
MLTLDKQPSLELPYCIHPWMVHFANAAKEYARNLAHIA